MQIEMWPIERVQPYERNPRINDDAVASVAASLKSFGWRQPIVVDPEGVIIVGHTRLKAAQKLGLTTNVDGLPPCSIRLAESRRLLLGSTSK